MKHFAIVGALTVGLTLAVYVALQAIGLLPIPASVQAGPIDQLFNIHIATISFLFSLITVFTLYSLVVFRQRKGDATPGAFFKANNRLEVLWTLIPLATVIGFSFMGARSLAEIRRVDPQALEVKVTAFQWGWSFEYPAYGIISQELHLPVDQQVNLKMSSRDVIHSFWVPEFRVKQDVLPGANLVKELRLTPNKTGQYTVMCSELCGGAHAYMNSPVLVQTQAEFNAWVQAQVSASLTDPVERGKKWSEVNGCQSCHSLDGSKLLGPTWKDLYQHEARLVDGSSVMVDDVYLKQAIVDPAAQVVEGFQPNLMPGNYSKLLTDEQVNDLVEYIKSVSAR